MTDLSRLRCLAGLQEAATPADPAQVERARSLLPVLHDRIDRLFNPNDKVGPGLIAHIFERYIEGAIRANQIEDEHLREIMRNTISLVKLYHSNEKGRVQVMKLAAKAG